MNKIKTFAAAIFSAAILVAVAALTANAQTATPDKLTLITQHPFSIQVLKDGKDITKAVGIKEGKYNRDGSGTRTLLDGTIVNGTWKFINEAQTQTQIEANGKISRWEIIELTEKIYRKRSLDDPSIEFVQTPIK